MQSAVSALYRKVDLIRGCCLAAAATLPNSPSQLGRQLLRWGAGATRCHLYPDEMLHAHAVYSAQAAARIFRYGQKKETYVYRSLYECTMEWVLYRLPPASCLLHEHVQRMNSSPAHASSL